MKEIKQQEQDTRRVKVVLSTREAREALGFFKKEFEISGERLTVRSALEQIKGSSGRSLAEVLLDKGAVRPGFGIFLSGSNVDLLNGIDTELDRVASSLVVLELVSRIAGG